MDIKDLPITEIGLSTRCVNALRRVGVETVRDMMKCSEAYLAGIRNMGRKSINEILEKIEECRAAEQSGSNLVVPAAPTVEQPDFDSFFEQPDNRDFVTEWLKERDIGIDELTSLSPRAYNVLLLSRNVYLHQIAFLSEEELLRLPHMDMVSARNIVKACIAYLQESSDDILADKSAERASESLVLTLLHSPEYHDIILRYVQANDRSFEQLGLSNHSRSRLLHKGYTKLSDFIFLTEDDLSRLPAAGSQTVQDISSAQRRYLTENADRIIALCRGDETVLLEDSNIVKHLLAQFDAVGFGGLSFAEMKEGLELPEEVPDARLKKIIGGLLAANELEYVDFRCYRVYDKLLDVAERCDGLNERNKCVLMKRLSGSTLEAIAVEYDLTRERVRQIVVRNIEKVRDWHIANNRKQYFDEDYYRYLYETYAFDKDAALNWLGMSPEAYVFLEITAAHRGEQSLEDALKDTKGLETSLRLKIRNYLNRDKLLLDGVWVQKRRAELEDYVVRHYCQENVTFDEFSRIYNDFLRENDIPEDSGLYCTPDVYRTRKARLPDSRSLLWKQNETLRFYDIDSRDYTELLETLNLDAYEDIELSTMKFVEDYLDLLTRYDIRDHYELHNLLRKIVPEGSFHDFHCARTPIIRFGTFDRQAALMDILIDHSPIRIEHFCELIHQEYGYDRATVAANYLPSLNKYYHQGVYRIESHRMSPNQRSCLMRTLTKDFYYIDEIRKIYLKHYPREDEENINPYNLKLMGFNVFARYVLRNYPSLDAYFEHLLTKDDMTDITPYKKRFVYVVMFSQKLNALKRSLTVIEYEPNHLVHFRRLERGGVTREMVQAFCDEVYEAVGDGCYFSISSLRQDDFDSKLFELGFDDWFYANLLFSDARFSYSTMFRNIILFKGQENITIKSFEAWLVAQHRSINTYDLMNEMTRRYGCRELRREDVLYRQEGTTVYYDPVLDRLYANADVYYRELDGAEELQP